MPLLAPGLLFDDEDAPFVKIGPEPSFGTGRGECVVAFFRYADGWVSADMSRTKPDSHRGLAVGLTEEGSLDAAYADGWAVVSVYGSAGSALAGDYINTVHVSARNLSRALVERVVGQLLDMGAVGFGYKVDAMPVQGTDGWEFVGGTVTDLLSRG